MKTDSTSQDAVLAKVNRSIDAADGIDGMPRINRVEIEYPSHRLLYDRTDRANF